MGLFHFFHVACRIIVKAFTFLIGVGKLALGKNRPYCGTNGSNWLQAQAFKQKTRFKTIHHLWFYPPRSFVITALSSANTSKTSAGNANTQHFIDTWRNVMPYSIFSRYLELHELDALNVHENLKTLLEIEDVTTLQEYVPLIQRNATLRSQDDNLYIFKFDASAMPSNIEDILKPNMDEVLVVQSDYESRSKASVVMDSVETLLSEKVSPYEIAIVKRVSKTEVEFAFGKKPRLNMHNKYDLIFRPLRIPIRYQHRALELLADNLDMRLYLFPQRISVGNSIRVPSNFTLINPSIGENPEQLQAVQNIACTSNPYAPFIIFGPPGTGKTTTIVESIFQIRLQYPQSRILVTAGSNSACDSIALRVCHYLKNSSHLHQYFMKYSVLPMLRIYSKSIKECGVNNIPEDLLQYCNKTGDYPSVEDIQKYGIVVATLSTVGKLVTGDVNKTASKADGYFTHVFIDEAAASTEAETLVGIMGIKDRIASNCRIILAGDHKQLGPVIKSDVAIKLGLAQSMMERLLKSDCYALDSNRNYNRALQARLRRNYRSHPEIVGLYNRLYYNNELLTKCQNAKSDFHRKWSILPNPNFPIGFQDVEGTTTKQGTSSCNEVEIDVVISYLFRLIKNDGVKQTEIGIISPYKLQSNKLKKRLKELKLNDIEVGSVETFQGREKEVIFVTMVRSKENLGFLRSERRLNVMLSRPKSLLLIIGNETTLRKFKDLRFIIGECKKKGTYFSQKMYKHNAKQNANTAKVGTGAGPAVANFSLLDSNTKGELQNTRTKKEIPKDNIDSDDNNQYADSAKIGTEPESTIENFPLLHSNIKVELRNNRSDEETVMDNIIISDIENSLENSDNKENDLYSLMKKVGGFLVVILSLYFFPGIVIAAVCLTFFAIMLTINFSMKQVGGFLVVILSLYFFPGMVIAAVCLTFFALMLTINFS